MAKARVDPEAEAAFLAKILGLAENSPNVADDLIDRFDEVLRLIGENPQAFGRGKIKGTRKFTMKPFALTYRIRNGQAEIGAIKVRGQKDAYAPKNMGT